MLHVEHETLKIRGIKRTYTFLHISDAHIVYAEETDGEADKRLAKEHTQRWNIADIPPIEAFYEALRYTQETQPDGLFITGDCVDYIHESCVRHLKTHLKTVNTDILYVYGNHEGGSYVETVPDTRVYYPYYSELMQGDPACWVKDYGEMLIVGVDDSDKKITRKQIDFLKAQIARKLPILLLLHVPLYTEALVPQVKAKWGGDGERYFTLGTAQDTDPTKEFCALIQRPDSRVEAIFAGHAHLAHKGEFAAGRMQYTAAPTFEKYIRKITIEPLTE